MTHNQQDWKPVIFNNTEFIKYKKLQQQPSSSSLASVGLFVSDEEKKTKYVSKEMSSAVSCARRDKKLTQKELAQKCNYDVSVISNIEKGGAAGACVYNSTHFNKIQTILGINIPRIFH